ncbi:MAG: hypothetical protein DHS20C15_07260 [Planctomycetota bacterium]|nr:MAG: hypothetical protein DHS20C15_07260 [Planctomycetota bacterium]
MRKASSVTHTSGKAGKSAPRDRLQRDTGPINPITGATTTATKSSDASAVSANQCAPNITNTKPDKEARAHAHQVLREASAPVTKSAGASAAMGHNPHGGSASTNASAPSNSALHAGSGARTAAAGRSTVSFCGTSGSHSRGFSGTRRTIPPGRDDVLVA